MCVWVHICGVWRGRDGASAAEYALVLALVGAGVVGALWALGGSMSTAMNNTGSAMPFQGP